MNDQQFFDACRTMFISDGWKAFQQEIALAAQSISLAGIESSDDFWKQKGRLEAFSQIAGWEGAVLAAEEQAEEDTDA